MSTQIIIFIFGAIMAYCYSQKNQKFIKTGILIGLFMTPIWLHETSSKQQWGMFALSTWYGITYCIGVYNYWFKPSAA